MFFWGNIFYFRQSDSGLPGNFRKIVLILIILHIPVNFSGEASASEGSSQVEVLRDAFLDGNITKIKEHVRSGTGINIPLDEDKNTPLIMAARQGYPGLMKFLLERGADIESRTRNGVTPLMAAVAGNHGESVRVLLDHGANPNVKPTNTNPDMNLTPPLLTAVSSKHYATTKILLNHGATVRVSNKHGMTPLHRASCDGSAKFVNLLLKYNIDIDVRDDYGWTPLLCGVANGSYEVTRILLARGANPNALTETQFSSLSVLGRAIRNSCPEETHEARGTDRRCVSMSSDDQLFLLRALLLNGAYPNIKTRRGNTVLHYYSGLDRPQAIKLLLHYNANPFIENVDGLSPSDAAIREGKFEIYHTMIFEHQVTSSEAVPKLLHQRLVKAVENSSLESIRTLLSLGANPNYETLTGWTALLRAIDEEKMRIGDRLLESGANPCRRNKWGINALEFDTRRKYLKGDRCFLHFQPRETSLGRRYISRQNELFNLVFKWNELLFSDPSSLWL